MLLTKSQGHWSVGSGGEDFFKVFTIEANVGHFGHVIRLICINIHSHILISVHMKLGLK